MTVLLVDDLLSRRAGRTLACAPAGDRCASVDEPTVLEWLGIVRSMKVLDELYLRRLRAQAARGPIPAHVAMVMDGNRRWAREAGLADVSEGHRRRFTVRLS